MSHIRKALRAVEEAAKVMAGKPPSKAQVNYVLHIIRQKGLKEPTQEQVQEMDADQVSDLIDGLKSKRGRAVWYGNGQFSHWQR